MLTRVVAIVVTYNRRALLEECIDALVKQKDCTCDILVIDNASTDGTEQMVRAKMEQTSVMEYENTGSNIGGAGGFHFGLKAAYERGYTHFWLMDDDAIPEPDALKTLLDTEEQLGGAERYGFLSSLVLWTDGQLCIMNRQRTGLHSYIENLPEKGVVQSVDQATFVSVLIPRNVLVKAGLPYAEYFLWGDDVEYTRRITKHLKLQGYLVSNSRVVHKMRTNTGSSIANDHKERIDRYYYAFRNEYHLYKKEGSAFVVYYIPKCVINLFRIMLGKETDKLERIKTLIRGMWDGSRFHPEIKYLK